MIFLLFILFKVATWLEDITFLDLQTGVTTRRRYTCLNTSALPSLNHLEAIQDVEGNLTYNSRAFIGLYCIDCGIAKRATAGITNQNCIMSKRFYNDFIHTKLQIRIQHKNRKPRYARQSNRIAENELICLPSAIIILHNSFVYYSG